jgi:phosphatidylglycerophosphate synthase
VRTEQSSRHCPGDRVDTMKLLWISFTLIILVTAVLTFVYSLRSRKAEGNDRPMNRAKMNMAMGSMFIAMAGLQAFALPTAGLRMVLLSAIAAVGLYNLVHGMRQYRRFSTSESNPS